MKSICERNMAPVKKMPQTSTQKPLRSSMCARGDGGFFRNGSTRSCTSAEALLKMRESSVDTIISTISMKQSASSTGGKKRRSVTGSIIWLYIERKFWNFWFAAPSRRFASASLSGPTGTPSSSFSPSVPVVMPSVSKIVSRICAWYRVSRLSWRASGGSTPMRWTAGGIARTRSATASASGEPSSAAISSTTRTASSWRVSCALSA